MLIIILAATLIIYLITLWTGSGKKLNTGTSKLIRIVLFILAPVLIIFIIIGQYNIYPRGYWVIKGMFWIIFFLMMILFGLGDKSVVSKIEKIVYGFFFYLPLGFIPLMLIPFIGIAIALIFYVSFIGDRSFIIYSDETIRIEKQSIRFMGPEPPLEIYVKEGLFSYKDTVLHIVYLDKYDSLSVRRLNDSTYFFIHYAPDSWQVPAGFEEITYSIKPK